MASFEDYGLAQAVHCALMQLRSRPKPATSTELNALAAKSAIPAEWQPQGSRTRAHDARRAAWLTICRLASVIDYNEDMVRDGRHDLMTDTSSLWTRAIEFAEEWWREEFD